MLPQFNNAVVFTKDWSVSRKFKLDKKTMELLWTGD
jgi:hypothetical protein